MRLRTPFAQFLVILLLSSVIAVVANGFAGRTRRLALPGFYPNALRVPPRTPQRVPPPPITETAALQDGALRPAGPATTTSDPLATGEPPHETAGSGATAPAPAPPTAAPVTTSAPSPTPAVPAPAQTQVASPAPVPNPLARFRPHPDKAFIEISGEDAMLLHRSGVLFLDARRSVAFEEGHIAAARSFSVWEGDIDDKVAALYEERSDPADQDRPIVIYCTGGACEDSHMLSQKLWGLQFNNVYVYKDGFPDWQKRGGPVRTGATP